MLVLDDVVSEIKRNEFNELLTQLFFNRRHVIKNGVLSIILVSQKYTMIPAKLRSNANWLVLFRLNPMDFETVYRDAVLLDKEKWQKLVETVFDLKRNGEEKQFNSLAIQVEKDRYFKNFKRIDV